MADSTIKQLKSLKKFGPDKNWLKDNKAQLMSRFFVDVEPTRLHYWEMFLVKAGAVAMLILLATGGTLAAVSAAQNSLPGDLMYPLKLVVEKVQVRLVSTEDGRADLKTELASRRLREFHQLTSQPEVLAYKEKEIVKVVSNFKKEISDVGEHLNKAKEEGTASTLAVAKQVNLEVTKYGDVLAAANKKLPSPLQEQIKEAINSVEETKVASLKVIIERSPEEDSEVAEEMTLEVAAQVQKAEVKIEEVREEVAKIVQELAEDTQTEDTHGQELADLLAKIDEVLVQAKQDLEDRNLLAVLDQLDDGKGENLRALIERVSQLVAQASDESNNQPNDQSDETVVNQDAEVSTELVEDPESASDELTDTDDEADDELIDNLTTPASLVNPE